MKKVLAVLVMVLMFCGSALADPWLVSDPNDGATVFILEMDGVELQQEACESDGSIRFDMASYAGTGDHVLRAKAGNIWGWSAYSDPFNFNADIPGVPSGFGFSAE